LGKASSPLKAKKGFPGENGLQGRCFGVTRTLLNRGIYVDHPPNLPEKSALPPIFLTRVFPPFVPAGEEEKRMADWTISHHSPPCPTKKEGETLSGPMAFCLANHKWWKKIKKYHWKFADIIYFIKFRTWSPIFPGISLLKKIFGVHAGLGINLTGLGVRGFRTPPPGRRPPGLMDHINAPTTSDLEKYTFRYKMEKI
jgi:hypothetical protein